MRLFGVPVIVAINHCAGDSEAEVTAARAFTQTMDVEAVVCRHWADGGAGAEDLARRVVDMVERGEARFAPLYPDEMPLFDKIETVARRIYRAEAVVAERSITDQLLRWQTQGFGHLPVCMAKTQYSFTTDPDRLGAPTNHEVRIREVRLAAGAGFVVAICGDIMTMPGLPRRPAAERIGVSDDGDIVGLF